MVIKQLDKDPHRTLRVLSKHVKKEDVRAFVETAVQISEPGDRNNVDAVLQVSVSANKEIYEAIRRCDKVMCKKIQTFGFSCTYKLLLYPNYFLQRP